MTVSNKAVPKQYIGNGVTTSFSFPYIFYNEDDLEVYIDDDLQSSGYTVSGEADPVGGSVNFSSAPAVDAVVTIQRVVELKQGTDFRNFDGNPADVTEKQFDLNVMMAQQNASVAARSLKYPTTIYGITNASLPTPEDGKALVFLGTDGAITASSSYIADAVADATAAVTGASLVTATSTTSLTVTGTGEKTFTVLPSKGFALGMRLRASSDDGTKINEGLVTDYIDTALTINVDYVYGSGTHADWNIGIAGSRGAAGAGSGDMLSSNNLSDVASAATAFNTIKQAATDTNSGVVELATVAEGLAGTDAGRVITAEVLGSVGLIVITDPVSIGTGTTKDFTIPTKARRITLHLSGVSLNASDNVIIQLGDAGGIETIGYTGSITTLATSTLATVGTGANGMAFANSAQLASTLYSGDIVLEKVSSSSNSWNIRGQLSTGSTAQYIFTGNKILDQELTTIRLTSYGGAATFDAGTVSYSVEY